MSRLPSIQILLPTNTHLLEQQPENFCPAPNVHTITTSYSYNTSHRQLFFFGDDSDGGVCGNHAAGGNIVAIAADNVLTTP